MNIKKIALNVLFCCLAVLAMAQDTSIDRGSGIMYFSGTPGYTPDTALTSELAYNKLSGEMWHYNRDSLKWKKLTGITQSWADPSGDPTPGPFLHINRLDGGFFQWTGAAWEEFTPGAGGGTPGDDDGAVQYNNGGVFGGDDLNFFWDDTNNRLGIGTNAPTDTLDVNGSVRFRSDFKDVNNATGTANEVLMSLGGSGAGVDWVDIGTAGIGDNLGDHTATQQISSTAGTAALPGYSFSGDPNSGIFGGTDEVSISTGGTEWMKIDATGNLELPGLTYLNTSTPTVHWNGGFGTVTGQRDNLIFGYQAAQNIHVNSRYNNFYGRATGQSITGIVSGNNMFGLLTGAGMINGSYNILMGYVTSRYISDGVTFMTNCDDCIHLGRNTEPLADGDDNSIIIGRLAEGKGANTIVLGDTTMTIFSANHYEFNIDQDTTSLGGQPLIFNSGTGQIEIGTITAGGDNLGDHIATQQILGTDGTAALPGYSFSSDPNSGIYSSAADQLDFSTGGTQRAIINASGNVGIGTTSPTHKLHVDGTTYLDASGVNANTTSEVMESKIDQTLEYTVPVNNITTRTRIALDSIYMEYDVATGVNFKSGLDAFGWYVEEGGTKSIIVEEGGDVGIGTSTPAYKLDVLGDVYMLAGSGSDASYILNQPTAVSISTTDGSDTAIETINAVQWKVEMGAFDNILTDTSNNVWIGNFKIDADQSIGPGQDNYTLVYDNAAGTWGAEPAPYSWIVSDGTTSNTITNGNTVTFASSEGIKLDENAKTVTASVETFHGSISNGSDTSPASTVFTDNLYSSFHIQMDSGTPASNSRITLPDPTSAMAHHIFTVFVDDGDATYDGEIFNTNTNIWEAGTLVTTVTLADGDIFEFKCISTDGGTTWVWAKK